MTRRGVDSGIIAAMRSMSDILPGTRVGPYTVVREIGRGATAVVVLARSASGEQLAVKVRPRGVPAADRRFLREFEAMRALRLPGVVRVHEAGLDTQHVWFSMEFVDGRSFLEATSAPDTEDRIDRVLDLGCQLLDVLARLHDAGLAHRDIKPSNVLVDHRDRVRVLDFGIGRFFEQVTHDRGEGEGTLRYMAPEQLAGLRGDQRVDLFATGLMLHEALAGPRDTPSNPLGWVTRTCLYRLASLASIRARVPRRLSHVVERLLDVSPQGRPDAREAATALRRVRTKADSHDWPEAPFVDPGPCWARLQEALESESGPRVLVLQGPSGSGRRRLVEQLQRHALLDGVRTVHVRCDVTSVGGPLSDALEIVLGVGQDESWVSRVVAGSGGALRQMWPHLPVPPGPADEPVPTMTRVAEAAAGTIARAAEALDLVLVVHELEQVDVLTGRALQRLAALAEGALRLVLVHEPRWSTERSDKVLRGLHNRAPVEIIEVGRLPGELGRSLLQATHPGGHFDEPRRSSPQRLVEQAYAALAGWRHERWTPPGAELWPLAVHTPLPQAVLTTLVGDAVLDSPWIRQDGDGISLAGGTAERAARTRLADLATAARAIADTWMDVEGDRADPAALARLQLLAAQPEAARAPTREAALAALQRGHYAEARRWLFLLDALPRRQGPEPFDLAVAKARVALVTEADEPRDLLVDGVEKAANSPAEHATATLLRAAYQLRQGLVRSALADALRTASPGRAPTPELAVEALVLATRCRLRLHQTDDARAQLTRAEALLAAGRPGRLVQDVALLRAEVLLRGHELDAAGAQAEALTQDARRRGHLHDEAQSALLLARVLRLAGRRARAESLARTARAAAQKTGDLSLGAEASLHLATLLVERGDAAGAVPLLDGTIRQLRGLRLDHRMPSALRVVLNVALAQGDPHAADVALATFRTRPGADPEAPATLVRWWRSRGDLQTALQVPPPGAQPRSDDWATLLWTLERARVHIIAGDADLAVREASTARAQAAERGFDELELYGRLLQQAASDAPQDTWVDTTRQALASVWTELCFGALELDARRREARGDTAGAEARWRTLRARCEEIGYQPGFHEASGWLDAP